MADDPEFSIGELADRVGLSVRALRHYDEIGLLVPSHRTAAEHRRYGPAEVTRLYEIVALRQLGLGLDEIASALAADGGADHRAIAERHLARVDRQLAELTVLRGRLLEHLAATSTDSTLEVTAMTIRLDRITTRSGDDGTTQLGNRARVPKTDARIEAIGAVDELNAHVGVALEAPGVADDHAALLVTVQHQLFDLGADLSDPDLAPEDRRVGDDDVAWLEHHGAELNEDLAPLTSFVLPGGGAFSAQLHVARTVCRRAERRVLAVGTEDVAPVARYLNRLSDTLFILGRAGSIGEEWVWDQDRRQLQR